jgi:hypothetical protein
LETQEETRKEVVLERPLTVEDWRRLLGRIGGLIPDNALVFPGEARIRFIWYDKKWWPPVGMTATPGDVYDRLGDGDTVEIVDPERQIKGTFKVRATRLN